eukprot:m.124244 g.124244  ORF g.124244 m.124244 type:complete len:255 (+) comp15699_c0_seq1:100-864(+)
MDGLQKISDEVTETERKSLRAMEQGEQTGEVALFTQAALSSARHAKNRSHVESIIRDQPSPEPNRVLDESSAEVKPLLGWAEDLKQRSESEDKALRLKQKRQKEEWTEDSTRFSKLFRQAKGCTSLEALDAFIAEQPELQGELSDVRAAKRSHYADILTPRPDLEEEWRKERDARAATLQDKSAADTTAKPATSNADGEEATSLPTTGAPSIAAPSDNATPASTSEDLPSDDAKPSEASSTPVPLSEQRVFIRL